MPQISELDEAKCRELLSAGVVGRIGLTTAEGPHVVPINYVCIDDLIVFRTSADSLVGRYAPGRVVAFQIDRIDYEHHTGWSVLAVGECTLVEDAEALRERTPFWRPKPWAQGDRGRYLQIACGRLTGRRIGGGWTYDNETPVRART